MAVTKDAYKITSVIAMSDTKAKLIRIEPTDLGITLREIYNSLSTLCWINNLPNTSRMFKMSVQRRAERTVEKLEKELKLSPNSSVSSSAGEYIVSELAHSSLVNDFGYLDIPLAELFKQKAKGNPGFDFFAVNPEKVIMLFGEAKYSSTTNAYDRAFKQIFDFVEVDGKDVMDMADLEHFCSEDVQDNVANGIKGYVAAFSSTSMSDKVLKSHIEKDEHYRHLLKYEEVVCVAVNITGDE